MDHIEVKIGYEMIRDLLMRLNVFDDVRLEKKDDVLNLVLTSKVLGFFKIPVSIKMKFSSFQEKPEDPLILSVETNRLVKAVLREHSGKVYEYDGESIKLHPFRFSTLLKKMVIYDGSFEDDHVRLLLRVP